jgi:hypothetical protein
MYKTIVNLTPHPITLARADGTTLHLEPAGAPLRLVTRFGGKECEIDGVAVHGPQMTLGFNYMPPERAGQIYVVSQLAAVSLADRHPHRKDFAYPSGSSAVRDKVAKRLVRVRN